MSQVCQICDDKTNLSTRKSISCQYCNFKACRTCCETYLLNESVPKCMNPPCNREWTRQFMSSQFTAVFLNKKFKSHRENVLYERERALLPSTQPLVEREYAIVKLRTEMAKLRDEIQEKYVLLHSMQTKSYELMRRPIRAVESETRFEFVRGCPDSNCRGFLSTQWKCGICEQWACNQCHQLKGATRDVEHTCNPDDVATAQLLSQNTKPCPKCHTGIYKLEGCNQMFCTQCHTGFDWRTGQIQTNIHNPHYFEWLRRNGAATDNQPIAQCNELTHNTFTEFRNLLTRKHANHPESQRTRQMLETVVRNTIHLRHVEMDRYRPANYEHKNRDLRVQFMMNQLDEDRFKTLLQQNEKRTEKKREIYNVLEVLMNTITDILFRFLAHLRESAPGTYQTVILDEIGPIVTYVNEQLADIGRTYKSRMRTFDNSIYLQIQST